MHLTRRTWLGQGLALSTLPWLATGSALAQGGPPATPASPAALALQALFARFWDETARWHPEWATFRGDHRYGDRFTDASPEAEAARNAQGARWLAEARAIPREPLTPIDRTQGFAPWKSSILTPRSGSLPSAAPGTSSRPS